MPETAIEDVSSLQESLEALDPRTRRVVELSIKLCEIPSVSVPPPNTPEEASEHNQRVELTADVVREFCEESGLRVIQIPGDPESGRPYPFLAVTFAENAPYLGDGKTVNPDFRTDVAFVGHTDVVPAQNEAQFTPRIEGDMLIGRGTADMKTVVASYLVWMAEQQAKPGPKPPVVLLLSTCEENGSVQGNHIGDGIRHLTQDLGGQIQFVVVGERTGAMSGPTPDPEKPVTPKIEEANRGWRWYRAETQSEAFRGKAGLKRFANIIKQGRESIVELNNGDKSPRMEKSPSWRSGFVNSFTHIGPDAGLEKMGNAFAITVTIKGESKHAASIKPDTPTAIEKFSDFLTQTEELLGEDSVHLASLAIGADGNYNSVTEGGEMQLVLNLDNIADEAGIPSILQLIKAAKSVGAKLELTLPKSIEQDDAPGSYFGLDVREISEHTPEVNKVIAGIRTAIQSAGGPLTEDRLEAINEGEGWECDHNNPHLIKLRKAFEQVYGEPPVDDGKLHGNDGRLVPSIKPGEKPVIVYGGAGWGPHRFNEAHDIRSIGPYMETLDAWADQYPPELRIPAVA